jgi:hypothetical protein
MAKDFFAVFSSLTNLADKLYRLQLNAAEL